MSSLLESVEHATHPSEDLLALQAEMTAIRARLGQQEVRIEALSTSLDGLKAEERLSLIVFSGNLDRLIAAFVLATGAAAMGMQVSMFFTFWATAALRGQSKSNSKTLLERLLGWMMPRGSRRLPLSQLNAMGCGPIMMRRVMRKKGVASVDELIELAAEMDVEVNVCSMSMDLLGIKTDELRPYPRLAFCGVSKFLEQAAPGKLTMFI